MDRLSVLARVGIVWRLVGVAVCVVQLELLM